MRLSKKGFTIIELMVVTAIISLISTSVFVQLQTGQQKARDGVRMRDLSTIKAALNQFYANNEFYPGVACTLPTPQWDCNGYDYASTSFSVISTPLAPYLARFPRDPLQNTTAPWATGGRNYAYGNVGRFTYRDQYDLLAQLEYTDSQYRCGVNNYRFYFNGASPWCTAYGGQYSNQIYEASPL